MKKSEILFENLDKGGTVALLNRYFISIQQRSQWWDAFLDNHVLEGIKAWLEPLADASLPALDIQRAMFKTLSEV